MKPGMEAGWISRILLYNVKAVHGPARVVAAISDRRRRAAVRDRRYNGLNQPAQAQIADSKFPIPSTQPPLPSPQHPIPNA